MTHRPQPTEVTNWPYKQHGKCAVCGRHVCEVTIVKPFRDGTVTYWRHNGKDQGKAA